jgi:hypothetical protein
MIFEIVDQFPENPIIPSKRPENIIGGRIDGTIPAKIRGGGKIEGKGLAANFASGPHPWRKSIQTPGTNPIRDAFVENYKTISASLWKKETRQDFNRRVHCPQIKIYL